MANNKQKYSREEALDVRIYLRLFIGALSIENDGQRVRTVVIVLCAGRLGLRANEIQHMHEGWIDWKKGVIRVPAHDPCFCKWCLDSAVSKVASKKEVEESELSRDDDDVLKYVYKNQYEPKPNASARVVPFGWSKRITAWLLHFFEKNEFVNVTQQQMRDDIRKAAQHAERVDPSGLTPHPLRATGATFYADAGLVSKPLKDLMGWSDRTQARRYVRASGRQLTNTVYELFGRGEWAPELIPEDPDEKLPVACDPQPFAAEIDVDPRNGTPEARANRVEEHSDQEEPLYNPRRKRRPDDVPYHEEKHDLPGHIDPNGPSLQDPDVERISDDADLRKWTGHLNEQREPAEDDFARRSGLDDFGTDQDGTTYPVTVTKGAYVVCLVLFAWLNTLGSMG